MRIIPYRSPNDNMTTKRLVIKGQNKWKKSLLHLYNQASVQFFLAALLMVSLFLALSFVLANAPDSENTGLYATLISIFAVFIAECIFLSIFMDGYFLSFFFWMDLIGTLSILLDIGWITNYFLPNGNSNQGTVLRVTRIAKLGARVGRLMKLVRLLTSLSFVSCFSSVGKMVDHEPTMSAIKKVSVDLSTVLSTRVSALVLLIVIVVPFLNYSTNDYSPEAWITNIKIISKNSTTTHYDVENMARKIYDFYVPKAADLYSIRIESPLYPPSNAFYKQYPTRDIVRQKNIISYDSSYHILNHTSNAKVWYNVKLEIDNTRPNQLNALYGILIIILVMLVLFIFTASFNTAVSKLVVLPLEKMMITLRHSAKTMIDSMKAFSKAHGKDIKEDDSEPIPVRSTKRRNSFLGDITRDKIDHYAEGDHEHDEGDTEQKEESEEVDDMETEMLEKMVEKLARIVQHVLPGTRDVVINDANVDNNVATWLNQSYSESAGVPKTPSKDASLPIYRMRGDSLLGNLAEDEEEKKRMLELDSMQIIVSREKLNSWEFDVLQHSNDELSDVVCYVFTMLKTLDEFKVSRHTMKAFLTEISNRYINTNTYHNYKHGVDVFHTVYRLIKIPELDLVFSSLERFALLIGAIAHDVGHIGVNNAFLVKTKHELALRHNDKSPLENMHCVVLYEILAQSTSNIFSHFSDSQWKDARKVILTAILGTDMLYHFEQISKCQLFLEVNGEDVKEFCSGIKDEIACLKDDKNRLFMMELLLHSADISNPFKPFNICEKWALLVVEEFCLQGDKERMASMEISPMCDREQIVLGNMQMGFIEFVVAPLIITMINIFPPIFGIGNNMLGNYTSWAHRRKIEINSDQNSTNEYKLDECRKIDERIAKFTDRMKFLKEFEVLPKRRRMSVNSAFGSTDSHASALMMKDLNRKAVPHLSIRFK